MPGRYEHTAEAVGTFLLLAVGLSAVASPFYGWFWPYLVAPPVGAQLVTMA